MTERPLNEGERTGRDADGKVVREYDDVVLLTALPLRARGSCDAGIETIPAGTPATAITLLDEAKGLFDLECYLDEHQYGFATGGPGDIRLVRTIEDKKTVEL